METSQELDVCGFKCGQGGCPHRVIEAVVTDRDSHHGHGPGWKNLRALPAIHDHDDRIMACACLGLASPVDCGPGDGALRSLPDSRRRLGVAMALEARDQMNVACNQTDKHKRLTQNNA